MNKTMPQRHKERLASAIKKIIVDIEDHIAELEVIESIKVSNPDKFQDMFVQSILKDAFEEAQSTLLNGFKLAQAHSKMK